MIDRTEPLPVRLERDRNVSVFVDDDLFTSYRYRDDAVKKPILLPINAPSGEPVTRGYPVDPRPNDRRDHPHQVGNWFTHGDVNGFDFWNYSTETPPEHHDTMGRICQKGIIDTAEYEGRAKVGVECQWCRPDDSVLLEETTHFTFHARAGTRIIDRTTTLSTRNEPVTFHDNKEGLFGLRVTRPLELHVEDDLVFTDSAGIETVVKSTGGHRVTGTYRSSEGHIDDETWGARAKWMELSGTVAGTTLTLAIFDHPGNPGHPTYWMARPYGLFAANPLGPAAFDDDSPPLDFTINSGDSTTFRYRLLVTEHDITTAELDAVFERFVEEID